MSHPRAERPPFHSTEGLTGPLHFDIRPDAQEQIPNTYDEAFQWILNGNDPNIVNNYGFPKVQALFAHDSVVSHLGGLVYDEAMAENEAFDRRKQTLNNDGTQTEKPRKTIYVGTRRQLTASEIAADESRVTSKLPRPELVASLGKLTSNHSVAQLDRRRLA